jgi:hypothetical protein
VGKLEEKNHLKDPGLDGRIILNGCSRSGIPLWTGLIWLRIGTGGGHLQARQKKNLWVPYCAGNFMTM